jgi:hypothetical protein
MVRPIFRLISGTYLGSGCDTHRQYHRTASNVGDTIQTILMEAMIIRVDEGRDKKGDKIWRSVNDFGRAFNQHLWLV